MFKMLPFRERNSNFVFKDKLKGSPSVTTAEWKQPENTNLEVQKHGVSTKYTHNHN